jgi:hypothetical protein
MNAESEGSVLSGLLIGIMSVITFAWGKTWALTAGS